VNNYGQMGARFAGWYFYSLSSLVAFEAVQCFGHDGTGYAGYQSRESRLWEELEAEFGSSIHRLWNIYITKALKRLIATRFS
jgi:hypothetical protein